MVHEPARRKPRIPLSQEEVYYVRQLKQLRQFQKKETFKSSFFYKFIHTINVLLACVLSYGILSILTVCFWQKTYVSHVICKYGESHLKHKQRAISELQLTTTQGETIHLKTTGLVEAPVVNQPMFMGKDYVFRKTLKAKLAFDGRVFWHIHAYPLLTVCSFALVFSFLVYAINKHLTPNGLLVVFGLLSLGCCYFMFI